MAKIILVDGPDNAGKTTFINDIMEISERYVKIDFPKRTVDGRFDVKSRNEVGCFETMLNYLDPTKIYLLDRGYISNWVYGRIRQDADSVLDVYEQDYVRLCQNHDVFTIILTRNEMTESFEDDLITLSSFGFNTVISHFEEFAIHNEIQTYQLLNHDGSNKVIGFNASERNNLITEIIKWAR